MSLSEPQFICVTPTKNESWIIRQFVAAAKCWADHVIIADQLSTDGTREFLQSDNRVNLVLNDSPVYDEAARQRMLLERARQVAGRRVLIGLDADEALSANSRSSRDWNRIKQAAPGTILRFRWVNILPGFEKAWIQPNFVPLGFVDDGSPHSGRQIHSPRVPHPENAPTLDLEEIVVLHFQYVLWERMASKQRWYQAWEYTQHRQKGPLDIFRQYNHMHGSWNPAELHPVRSEWLDGYKSAGVDYRQLKAESITWWDREMIQMLCKHGAAHFRRIAIWDHDWNTAARTLGITDHDLSDPRSWSEKLSHRLLSATQSRRANWGVRGLERLLRTTGW